MLISVDVGSGFTKYKAGNRRASFMSVTGPMTDPKGYSVSTQSIVEWDGKCYAVDRTAAAQVHPAERSKTLSRDWALSDGWMALLFTAIARAQNANFSGEVHLCTGLPLAFWEDKDKLANRLIGEHAFQVEGKTLHIRITRDRLYIVPQAMGLYFYLNKLRGDMSGAIAAWDWGTYTTGAAFIENGEYIKWKSFGMEVGSSTIHQMLGKYLEKQYGITASPEQLVSIARNRCILVSGKAVNLNDAIDDFARVCAEPLLINARKMWGSGKDVTLYMGGGASDLYLRAVEERFPHVKLIGEPEENAFAVVEGYNHFMNEKIKRKSKETA